MPPPAPAPPGATPPQDPTPVAPALLGDAASSRSSVGVRVVAGIVALAVVGGVGWALFGRSDDDPVTQGGGNTPEKAVQAFADAVADDDALGIVTALDPDEVGPLAEVVKALEARGPDLDMGGLDGPIPSGMDLRVTGLTMRTRQLAPDVVRVDLDGDVDVDLTKSTIDLVTSFDEVNHFGADDEAHLDLGDAFDGHADELDEVFVVTVRRGDTWHVSPLYTLAESIRVEADADEPDFTASRATKPKPGAATPTEAVEDFAKAIETFEPEAGLDLLPPSETAFARDYFGLVMDALEEDEVDLDDERDNYDPEIDDLELSETELSDDKVRVDLTGLTVSVNSYDSYDEEVEDRVEVKVDGRCWETDAEEGDDAEWCLEQWMASEGIDPALADLLPEVPYVIVVKEGGTWYVSPIETIAAYLSHAAENLRPEHLQFFGIWDPRPIDAGEVTDIEPDSAWVPSMLSVPLDGEATALVVEPTNDEMEFEVYVYDADDLAEGSVAAAYGVGEVVVAVPEGVDDAMVAVVPYVDSVLFDDDDWEDIEPSDGAFSIRTDGLVFEQIDLDEEFAADIDDGELQALGMTFDQSASVEFVVTGDAEVVQLTDEYGYTQDVTDGEPLELYSGDYTLIVRGTDDGDYSVLIAMATTDL